MVEQNQSSPIDSLNAERLLQNFLWYLRTPLTVLIAVILVLSWEWSTWYKMYHISMLHSILFKFLPHLPFRSQTQAPLHRDHCLARIRAETYPSCKKRNKLFQRNNMHKVFTWARPGGSQGWRCSTGVRKPWWLQSCNPLPGIGTSLLEQGPAAPVWNCIIPRLWSTFAYLDHQPKGTGADFVLPDRITSSRVKPFVNTCTWGDWYDHLLRQIWSRGLPLSELASPTGTIQHNILGRPWPICQFHSSKKSILQLKIIVQLPPFRRTEC